MYNSNLIVRTLAPFLRSRRHFALMQDRRIAPGFETLETRNLMTSLTGDLSNGDCTQDNSISEQDGEVFICGTNTNDTATIRYVESPGEPVSINATDWIRVTMDNGIGSKTEYYNTAKTNHIEFHGKARDDTFDNRTWIPSTAYGNDGNDLLKGGFASDHAWGGEGDDSLIGNYGNDVLDGEEGDDFISGGRGLDFLVGADGDDLLQGGLHDDSLFGGTGRDMLLAGEGDDILDGGEDQDELWAGNGNDVLIGGRGRDELHGEDGNDLLIGGYLLPANPHPLMNTVWNEWTSNDSYMQRSLNVQALLIEGVTVANDGALDELYGENHDFDDGDMFFEDPFDIDDAVIGEVVIC